VVNGARFVLKCRAVRSRRAVQGAILAAALLLGCDGGPCKASVSAVTGLDGGQVRCVRPEDCPLTSNVAICADTGEPTLPTQSCVRCEQTQCVKYACSQ
jgi:hypothetical protein